MKKWIAFVLTIMIVAMWGTHSLTSEASTPLPQEEPEIQATPANLVTELEEETQTYTIRFENNQRVYIESRVLPAGTLSKITPLNTEYQQIEYQHDGWWRVEYIRIK